MFEAAPALPLSSCVMSADLFIMFLQLIASSVDEWYELRIRMAFHLFKK